MASDPAPAELLVCVTCRRGTGGTEDGAALFEALAAQGAPSGVRLAPVECLSNCSRGCTIALRGPGRWSYVYGGFNGTEDAATVLDGTVRYAAAADGLVPWRARPEHFRRNCIARLPPLEI